MPDFCTCGTQLVPDALFCHKCGKPQREIIVPEPPPVEPVPPPRLPEVRPLNFHNAVAMRIALLVAGFATLLSFLPYLNWLAAGFFAVVFYRRRTGQLLNLESGVRMGWITGLMMFAIMALLLTASIVMMQALGGPQVFREALRGAVDPKRVESVIEQFSLLQKPLALIGALIQFFVLSTLLSMAGGALAVKLAGRS